MAALIMDGKTMAESIERSLAQRVAAIKKANGGVSPVLATILVGNDPASATYVRMKGNACARVGMESKKVILSEETTTGGLIAEIGRLNDDPAVHGILLQHPVPQQIDERHASMRYRSQKTSTASQPRLRPDGDGKARFGSATPAGIMRMIDHYGINLKESAPWSSGVARYWEADGDDAVEPQCHGHHLPFEDERPGRCRRDADIVVGAVGRPKFIKADWIREGAVLIDAGYHPAERCGDIDLEAAAAKSSAYTPVPGGVGPMTIASLMLHTVEAAERAYGISVD
jgi:methylenetetrahydrofolate dehydrogenase (NADP+)/methenyltetrahydrofolate cyclohydrolase